MSNINGEAVEAGSVSRFLSDRSFKQKFILMVLVPLLGLFLFSIVGLVERVTLYVNQGQVQSHVERAIAASALVHQLQRERGLSAGFVGTQGANFRAELIETRRETDQAFSDLTEILSDVSGMDSLINSILSADEARSRIRNRVDNLSIPVGDSIDYYTGEISTLIDLISIASTASTENDITIQLNTYLNLIKSKEYAGQERAVLNNTFARGSFAAGMYERFLHLVSSQESYNDVFLNTSTEAMTEMYTDLMEQDVAVRAEEMRARALEHAGDNEFGVSAAEWYETQTAKIDLLYTFETFIADYLIDETDNRIFSALWQLIVVAVIFILSAFISVLILFSISGNVQDRTNELLAKMEAITEGDLTLRLSEKDSDEITKIEKKFNELVETLHSLIGKIVETVNVLKHSSSKLLESSNGLASEMEESSIQSMNISSAVEEMNQNLENISTAVEEMSTTINEVARGASEASKGSRAADQAAERMGSLINEQAENTKQIEDLMGHIASIAAQTNLLALNAAIEAAGAGEAGKGFAVVAGEVKELAMQSGNFSTDAREKISHVVQSVEKSVEAVNGILGKIRTNNEAVISIASSVEEQSTTMKEVSGSMSQLSQVSKETAANVSGIADAVKRGSKSAQETSGLAAELEEVAANIDSQIKRFRLQS